MRRGKQVALPWAAALLLFAVLVGVAALGTGRSRADTVTVTQTDFVFTPSTVNVVQGDTLSIANDATDSPHTFTISAEGIDIVNDPGQTQTLSIDLTPGSYPFICSFHFATGMTGTLIVGPSPSPSPSESPSPSGSPSPSPSASGSPSPSPSGSPSPSPSGSPSPSPSGSPSPSPSGSPSPSPSESPSPSPSESPSPSPSESPSPSPSPTQTQTPSPTTTTPPPPGSVGVSQADFFFTPSTVHVGTGQKVVVANISADSPHTFTVTGTSISLTNNAGQTQSVVIGLAPGTYPFVCLFHEALGMVGTLIVSTTPAPGSGPPSSTSGGSAGPSASAGGTPSTSASPTPSSGPLAEGGGGGAQGGSAQGARGNRVPFIPLIASVILLGAAGGFVLVRFLRARSRRVLGG
jgi:plastocyanin